MLIKPSGLRCALCHGEARGLLEGCGACGALLHADCRRDLGRCPTIGCGEASVQAQPLAPLPPARARVAWDLGSALFRVGLAASLALGGFIGLDALYRYGPERDPERQVKADALAVRAAARLFKLEHRRWPRSLGELGAGRRPALTELPRDPEGVPYLVGWKGNAAYLARETAEGTVLCEEVLLFVSAPPRAEQVAPAATRTPAAVCGVAPQGAIVLQERASAR